MAMLDMTALELGRCMREKKISVREALDAVFAKIEEREKDLHCYLTLDAEGAYARAEGIQEKILRGEGMGPLFGVPLAVKDNLCTKGMRTTCGSRMLEGFVPAYKATAIRNAENAGMIVIGKTNMDEFAMGNTTENSYFGGTRNPVDESRVPGGSSGGSAAAVAAGECFLALGSDTGGSVRQPASHCGIVGIKPTYGTISRYGLIAYASSMDQVGTLTKDVADGAALLEAVASADAMDATCARGIRRSFAFTGKESISGLRIGIPVDYFETELENDVGAAVLGAARELERQGAKVEKFTLGLAGYAVPTYYTIACGEASSNLERYDGMKYGLRESAANLSETYGRTRSVGFGAEVKRRIMLGTYVLSEGYYDEYFLKALKVRRLIKEAFDRAFERYDVLLGPVAPTTAPMLRRENADPLEAYLADKYTVPANLAGLPAMSLPCGRDGKGLPIGLQLMGNLYREDLILRTGLAYEKVAAGKAK